MQQKKTLIIGWDAADWQIIEPLMAKGKMPALEFMVKNGVSGNLATLSPTLSPMLWTSIATGKRAYDHGICGFMENNPVTGEVIPVRSTSRKCKAVWNILGEAGLKTNLVNWWPSHPAEILNGVSVSNQFHLSPKSVEEKWPLNESAIYPSDWYDRLKDLRLHPAELTLAHVLPFIPAAADIDPEKDPVVKALLHITAHCSSVHNSTTLLMEETEWDFMAVYHEALDHYSHLAMKYHPPRMPGVPEGEYELYKGVVEAAYRFHDMMLERTLELAGADCDVILVSDHGFHSGNLRVPELPDIAAAPAMEHRKYGVFVAMGPSFKPGKKIFGASLLDITPTILHINQLPVGDDMEGKVLQNALLYQAQKSVVPSWENTQMKPQFMDDNSNSTEVLNQLEDLGYVDLKRDNKQQYVEHECLYNLCTSMLDGQKISSLIKKARLVWKSTSDIRFGLLLAEAYLQNGDDDSLENLINEMTESYPGEASVYFIKGMRHMRHNKQEDAIADFLKLEEAGVNSPQLFNEMGRAFLISGNLKASQNYFQKTLNLDSNNATALTGKAQCLLELGYVKEGMEMLEKSLELTFYQPNAHFLMAQASNTLGYKDAAIQALAVCLEQAPKHQGAINLKKKLMENSNSELPDPVIVVSGFPRSGTSMLMNILEKAGIRIYTDLKRQADEHNPAGYFEHSAVKKLGQDNAWVRDARNQVIKVVSPLLRYLPATERYKVLLINRPLTEVILSQEVMKGSNSEDVMRNFPFQMAVDLQNEKQRLSNWLEMQSNMDILEIEYYDCLEDPTKVIGDIERFLGLGLDQENAIRAIKPSLHRNKLGKS